MTKSLILSAILDLVAILNCPMMPIWHHPDFKSGYLYLHISAKIFSIDTIARSSEVHAGPLPHLALYQSYHGDSSHHSCLFWNSLKFGKGFEVSCQRHCLEKPSET